MKTRGKALGKALGYGALYFGMQSLAGVIMTVFLFVDYLKKYPSLLNMHPADMADLVMHMSVSQVPAYVTAALAIVNVLSLLLLWLFFILRKKKFSKEIGLRRARPIHLVLGVVIGLTFFCINILADSVMPYTQEQWQELEINSDMLMDELTAVSMLSVALAAPVAEEVFFRGLVYSRLRRGFGTVFSMLVSAAFFALGHGGTIWFFSAAAGGLLMAFAFERTGSLYIPILIHMINNTVAQALRQQTALNGWLMVVGAAICVGAIFLLWKTTEPHNPPVQTRETT